MLGKVTNSIAIVLFAILSAWGTWLSASVLSLISENQRRQQDDIVIQEELKLVNYKLDLLLEKNGLKPEVK